MKNGPFNSTTLLSPMRVKKLYSWFCRGILSDLRNRGPYYWSDWTDAWDYRVIPSTVYIFFANILPAIAFAQDMFDRTKNAYGVNEVLLASAMGGIVFGVFGGQPLCIVGVTGPIAVFNYTVFQIVDGMDVKYFPFMTWVCLWSFIMHTLIAVTNAVSLMKYVTQFSCDIFACFINVIYIQKGIQILIRQLEHSDDQAAAYFSIVVALCVLIFGVTFLVLGGQSNFGTRYMRKFVKDYSLPLIVVFFTGFTYFPGRISELNLLRLEVADAFQPTTDQFGRDHGWFINFWHVEVGYVFLAIPFAILLTALFYFDHNISSIICQGPEFDLKKPSAFHWDFFLLGITTLVSGFLGLPPPNGLIPQAPLHTLSLVKNDHEEGPYEVVEQRLTNTAQGLLTIGLMTGPLLTVLHLVPQGVLGGLFFMMGVPGLLGCEIVRRVGLLVTDFKLRESDPLYSISFWTFLAFMALSGVGTAAEIAITQTIAAVGFPGVLFLFMGVGALLPKFFDRSDLEILDHPAASKFFSGTKAKEL